MAVPWLFVLKNVPWADVIRNAPKVADGARKLWDAVARKPPTPAAPATPAADPAGTPETRIAALEQTVSELHEQMLASSQLIQALADQNTELVKRIEANRRRTAWLLAAMVGMAVYLI